MIYLDANVFVHAIASSDKRGDFFREFLKGSLDEDLFTCSLTWDEVVHSLTRLLGKEKALLEGEKLLSLSGLLWLPVSRDVIVQAQGLMGMYGLKPRDAIHAASALRKGISKIASDDTDFDKVKGLKRMRVG